MGLTWALLLLQQYMTMNDPYVLMNEERFQKETDYLNMLSSPDFENLNRKDEPQQHYVNVPVKYWLLSYSIKELDIFVYICLHNWYVIW